MKCHYEVLEAARDADADTLKKQYRKMALKYHPDKNPDDPEGAKQTFQIIQQAYDVLSDPQERAWYDNHREQILRGGLGEKLEEEGIDLFQYFSSSCYSGFSDDESGFFGVYNEVFNILAKEDMDFIDDEDSDFEIPCFGLSDDDYEKVVGPFYAYWASYNTPRSYTWLDKYDTRQGENRWVKRKMEAENKKVRDKAKKERNEVVRNLVQFVRKRDKRVVEYSKKLQEKAEMNKKKTLEFQKKQREDRKKLFEVGSAEVGGINMSEMEEQLRQLEGEYTDTESDTEDLESMCTDDELGEELDNLYCVACDKIFRTIGAKDNHESSRKHKDNLAKLIEEMNEDANLEEAEEKPGCSENELHISDGKISDDCNETRSTGKSKKQKKKHKKKLAAVNTRDSDYEQSAETEIIKPADTISDDDGRKKKSKVKNKKKTRSKKSDVTASETVPENNNCCTDDVEKGSNIIEVHQEDNMNKCEEIISIINASASDHEEETNLSNVRKGKQTNLSKNIEDPLKAENLCVQCRAAFPSKNKLFAHLKSSGHAVHIPTESKPTMSKKSKKKNKK